MCYCLYSILKEVITIKLHYNMTHGNIIYHIGKMKLGFFIICVISCCLGMKEGDDLSEVSHRNLK